MGAIANLQGDVARASVKCPFFVHQYSGICVSHGMPYIPSLAERGRYCHAKDFSYCPLYAAQGSGYVRVMFDDHVYGVIPDFMLDTCIDEGKVTKFCRADGWVVIGCDPIRVGKRPYRGPERRKGALRS